MNNRIKNKVLYLVSIMAMSMTSYGNMMDFQGGASLVFGQDLGGVIWYNGWNNLTTDRIENNSGNAFPYGSHGNTSPWGATLEANLGAGTAELFKTGGYGYIAGSSIHQGVGTGALVEGGTFTVSDKAIAGLQTVIFQIEVTHVLGATFHQEQLPVLAFGEAQWEADFSSLYFREQISDAFGQERFMERWAFQWDVTGLAIPEEAFFSVQWTGVGNSGIFSLQLDQGDLMAQVVPEPAHYALIFAGGLVLMPILRKKFNRS